MTWVVEYTDEFGDWFSTMAAAVQDDIDRSVGLLEAKGLNSAFHILPGYPVPSTSICANSECRAEAILIGYSTHSTQGEPPFCLLAATKRGMTAFMKL